MIFTTLARTHSPQPVAVIWHAHLLPEMLFRVHPVHKKLSTITLAACAPRVKGCGPLYTLPFATMIKKLKWPDQVIKLLFMEKSSADLDNQIADTQVEVQSI